MDDVIKIAICDDDLDFVNELEHRVYKISEVNNCSCDIVKLYNEKQMVKYCDEISPDIILTDIDMPEKNSVKPAELFEMAGFNVARRLQEKYPETEIMFISAHEEFAYQSFRYRPFSFVSKRDLWRLDEDLGELLRKVKIRKADNTFVHLVINDKVYSIDTSEILYFENEKHYIYTYTANGRGKAYRCSIREAYNQLKNAYFIYVHRSFLLNCRFIKYFDSQSIVMCDGNEIKVTRDTNRLKEAQKTFMGYKRSKR